MTSWGCSSAWFTGSAAEAQKRCSVFPVSSLLSLSLGQRPLASSPLPNDFSFHFLPPSLHLCILLVLSAHLQPVPHFLSFFLSLLLLSSSLSYLVSLSLRFCPFRPPVSSAPLLLVFRSSVFLVCSLSVCLPLFFSSSVAPLEHSPSLSVQRLNLQSQINAESPPRSLLDLITLYR